MMAIIVVWNALCIDVVVGRDDKELARLASFLKSERTELAI